MAEPFIGQITIYGLSYAPRGWAFCDGQILPIRQYTALFSLLGTYYGGDGVTTFALPDMRGRTPIHQGQGQGLSPYVIGEQVGVESLALLTTEIPTHTHLPMANNTIANQGGPKNNFWALESTGQSATYSNQSPNAIMNQMSVGPSGNSQPHENRQPFLTMSFCIAMEGIFPPRS